MSDKELIAELRRRAELQVGHPPELYYGSAANRIEALRDGVIRCLRIIRKFEQEMAVYWDDPSAGIYAEICREFGLPLNVKLPDPERPESGRGEPGAQA